MKHAAEHGQRAAGIVRFVDAEQDAAAEEQQEQSRQSRPMPMRLRISQWFLCCSHSGTGTRQRLTKAMRMIQGMNCAQYGVQENCLTGRTTAGAPHFMHRSGRASPSRS